MLAVVLELGYALALDWRLAVIAIGAFLINYRWKQLNVAWLVVWGALAGYLLRLI